MKHPVIAEFEQNPGEFIWEVLPSLTRDKNYQAILVMLRLAIREAQRDGKAQRLQWSAERSRN
jgi:hypothetical protein